MSARRTIGRLLRWGVGTAVVLGVAVPVALEIQLIMGRRRIAAERSQQGRVEPIPPFVSVRQLSMLPLIDFYATRPSLATEPGVSYLIRADDFTLLLDTGYNRYGEHPSPLLRNMRALGVDPARIDALFFSHLHIDHTGRLGELTVSPGAGVNLRPIPAYVPASAELSKWNRQPHVEVVRGPRALANGVASIGPIPRQLFLLGRAEEQALAVNLEGKGIVLFVGCGHQGARQLVERLRALFDAPIYAIVGGFHLPYGGGRAWVGPVDVQRIVGSDRFPLPWRGHEDVTDTIEAFKNLNPRMLTFSAHDSSDASIEEMRAAFGERYRTIRVGEEIVF